MPATDNKLLPLILQHVRELIEAQTLLSENDKYKIITPFPPAFNDFPDFIKDNLGFSDPEIDAVVAARDTWNAYDFFLSTDSLFYNYSYGIRSPDQSLSQVWKKFTNDAQFTDTADTNFINTFNEKKVAFLERFSRSTVGDLGRVDFYYTSPAGLQWDSGKIELPEAECERLKQKALSVYRSIENKDNDYLKSLITEIEVTTYTKIEYDFGFFDVKRAWMDPMLFENNGWKFRTIKEALYSENDPDFNSEDIRLCFAERFYIIKNYTGKLKATEPVVDVSRPARSAASPRESISIPDRSIGSITVSDHMTDSTSARDLRTASRTVVDHRTGSTIVHDHRTVVRNNQLQKKLMLSDHSRITTPERAGFIWVIDHWERERAHVKADADLSPVPGIDSIYKIAAVKCRVIPWKPVPELQL